MSQSLPELSDPSTSPLQPEPLSTSTFANLRKSKRKRVPTAHLSYDEASNISIVSKGSSICKSSRSKQIKAQDIQPVKDDLIEEEDPQDPQGPISRVNLLVLKTYDKVRRSYITKRATVVKSLWADNLQKLEQDLQSHYTFHLNLLQDPPKDKDLIPNDPKEISNVAGPTGHSPTASFTYTKDLDPKTSKSLKVHFPITTLSSLSRIPPVLAWTSIPYNIHEDDGKFLTNIPFLGDEVIDKDKKFIDDMVNLYQGKIHGISDPPQIHHHPNDPGSVNLTSKSPSNGQLSRERRANILRQDDDLFYDLLVMLKQEFVTKDEKHDEDDLFLAIIDTFKSLGTLQEVKERYQKILGKRRKLEKSDADPMVTVTAIEMTPATTDPDIEKKPKFLPILESGVPQQDPSTYFIPNIEGPYAKDLPKESAMHAYQFLFCRRCFQYDCPRGHNGDDQVDLKYYKQTRTNQISTFPFKCERSDCYLKNPSDPMTSDLSIRSKDQILSEWTPSDRSMFRCLIDSFLNPCYVSHLMLNKSCRQVSEFASLSSSQEQGQDVSVSTNPSAGPEPGSSGSTNSPPTCPTTINSKRKSKKSSSVTKKNLARRWINNVKRSEKSNIIGGGLGGIKTGGVLPPRFMPCQHHHHAKEGSEVNEGLGSECDDNNPHCYCGHNGTSCEKFCTCPPSCKRRFPGCRCTSTCDSKRCVCFFAARECDPDLCTGCGASDLEVDHVTCRNVSIQRRLHKHLLMAESDVAGWGIFIKEDAQKGDFIAEYRGEIISHDESERRGHVYDKIQHTFLFELNDHFVVDATRKGNKARFVNSSKNPNCEVKRMLVNGDHRIGIYAKRYIDAGEELFYDYEDVLEKQQKVASSSLPSSSLQGSSTH